MKPACALFQITWELEPPDGVLQHTIYTDGSAINAEVPAACRAGWGLAMIGPGSNIVAAAARGLLPTFTQSSGCAEIYAAAVALTMASPPITIATDYEHLLEGWQMGPGFFTHAGAKSGEAWKHFWRIVADFGPEHITTREVPARKPFLAVAQGIISFCDWLGNRKADELAKRGVMGHRSNQTWIATERDRIHKQYCIGK